ncbi:MAG TPA: stage III sporulation protein AF [Candidatus Mediterraneibacter norfolkensis]|nr:stage III sporulation protein AF [Candidatus Mediterraneibacter norfolkensis]
MLQQLYGWIQNIAVYLIVTAAVMHAIPGKDYGKYVRFFSGLVLILLLFTPVMNLSGMGETFRELYQNSQYELERHEIEEARKRLEEADILDFIPEEYSGMDSGEEEVEENRGSIEVEEIRVGE